MKKYILLLILFFFPIISSAAVINKVVASVGSIAITSYDIQKLREFDAIATGKKPSSQEALTKLITMSSLLVLSESYPEYYMDEAELRKQINNITNNSDPTSKQRAELYNKYSSLYRMVLRSDKVKRGLMYGNAKIKADVAQPIPARESKNFYNKNKKQFKDSPFPKLDLIIFAVESSSKWGLSTLELVEKQMAEIAMDLDSSSDFKALKRQHPKLKFTSFSGRTGLFTPDILILQKKIPDEIIGIALQNVLNLGTTTIIVKKNTGIYIPQPIPFRSTGVPTYVTLKILDIIQPKQLSFAEALPRIEEILRYQRAEKAIDNMIREQIEEGQLTLTPVDNRYRSVFRNFNK